jgi:hypothetical protein
MNRQRIKTAVMLLVAVLALIPFAWEPAQSMVYRPRVEEKLYSLVEVSGGRPVKLNVQGWTRVNRKFITLEELERLAEKAAIRLGESAPRMISEGDGDFRQVRIQSILEDGTVLSLAAQSLINYAQPESKGETYISVNIAQKIDTANSIFWSDTVRAALSFPFASSPQVLTTVIAARPGKMAREDQEKLISKMFSTAEAARIDGVNTEQLVSVTGFTPAIKDFLEIGDNEVNLNIAVRYHIDDGQTYIYIGSPLLAGEY